MAGLIGMAQTLGVYHYGYFTLNKRDIEYHGPNSYPSDQTAVLEWGLDAPFTPQDKPPLAIAMVIKSGDRRKWKRYRLVMARREKLRLPQRVLAVLDANTATSSGFFPCAISKEYLYGYATDGYRSPLWLCAAFKGSPTSVHARSGFRLSFHHGIQARQLVVLSGKCSWPARYPDALPAIQEKFSRILVSVAGELATRRRCNNRSGIAARSQSPYCQTRRETGTSAEHLDAASRVHGHARNWVPVVCHLLVPPHPIWTPAYSWWERCSQ